METREAAERRDVGERFERIKGKDQRKGSKTHTATHTRATVGPWASGVCEEGALTGNGLLFRLALRPTLVTVKHVVILE